MIYSLLLHDNMHCSLQKMTFLLTVLAWFVLDVPKSSFAQHRTPNVSLELEILEPATDSSLRGIHVINRDLAWFSGSNSTVIRTIDGGRSFSVSDLRKATGKSEFRDIETFGEKRAIVLGSGSPAFILKTENGVDWKQKYRDDHPKVFFDAFDFWDHKSGIAFSDPIDGKLLLLRTNNAGDSWDPVLTSPRLLAHEAGFAASGTCLVTQGKQFAWIGLGGKPGAGETGYARVLFSRDRGVSWNAAITPIPRSESAGIFSMVFLNENVGIACGGDYLRPETRRGNLALTFDGGKSWRFPTGSFPRGYRSCIAATNLNGKTLLIATGTNGTDVSLDQGESWIPVSDQGFHAIAFVPGKSFGWACGASGKVARFTVNLGSQ